MTEDARPIPDRLARELRALNDLELGALIADLGVDPLAPPGAKLRGALASIAEDPHPWWEGTLAGHAVDRLAKEPRRGRIAGGGALDHARRTWHGLAGLGAAARLLLPDPDLAPLLDLRAALDRRLDPREGERAGVALDRLTAAVVDASPDRAAIGRLARDFGISAEPRALPGAVADAAIAFSEELKRRPWAASQEIARMTAQLDEIRRFTGRADPVEGCKLLADEVAARGAKLGAWRDFALSWTGVAADDAAQIGALRERLVALAEVRAVPGGAHASQLAPSSCPAAELPRRMGRIWDGLAADLRAAKGLADEHLSVAALAGQAHEAALRQLAEVRAISHARAVDASKAEQAAADARREAAEVGRRAAAGDLAQREVDAARRSLGCPEGVALSEWVARFPPILAVGGDPVLARLRDLAVRAALTADGAAQAGEALAALREIAEVTGG